MDIKAGDVVTLKVNEIKMVVDSTNSTYETCVCKWHTEDGLLQTADIHECSLLKIDSEESLVL